MLRDERIVIVAEQRPDASEEEVIFVIFKVGTGYLFNRGRKTIKVFLTLSYVNNVFYLLNLKPKFRGQNVSFGV